MESNNTDIRWFMYGDEYLSTPESPTFPNTIDAEYSEISKYNEQQYSFDSENRNIFSNHTSISLPTDMDFACNTGKFDNTVYSVETTGLGWDDAIPIPDKIDVNPAPFSHANISWTVCYDDSCPTHYQDKMGANWFPQFRPIAPPTPPTSSSDSDDDDTPQLTDNTTPPDSPKMLYHPY